MSSRHCNLEPLGRWHETIYYFFSHIYTLSNKSLNEYGVIQILAAIFCPFVTCSNVPAISFHSILINFQFNLNSQGEGRNCVPAAMLSATGRTRLPVRMQFLASPCEFFSWRNMMSVVGKSTCSGFKTGLYISYHDGNAFRYIKLRGNLMKYARISVYFDTKYMTLL